MWMEKCPRDGNLRDSCTNPLTQRFRNQNAMLAFVLAMNVLNESTKPPKNLGTAMTLTSHIGLP